MKKNKIKRTHKLAIEIIDEDNKVYFDDLGNQYLKTKWIEVKEINLGSVKKPNKKINQIVFEPLKEEKGLI